MIRKLCLRIKRCLCPDEFEYIEGHIREEHELHLKHIREEEALYLKHRREEHHHHHLKPRQISLIVS